MRRHSCPLEAALEAAAQQPQQQGLPVGLPPPFRGARRQQQRQAGQANNGSSHATSKRGGPALLTALSDANALLQELQVLPCLDTALRLKGPPFWKDAMHLEG